MYFMYYFFIKSGKDYIKNELSRINVFIMLPNLRSSEITNCMR